MTTNSYACGSIVTGKISQVRRLMGDKNPLNKCSRPLILDTLLGVGQSGSRGLVTVSYCASSPLRHVRRYVTWDENRCCLYLDKLLLVTQEPHLVDKLVRHTATRSGQRQLTVILLRCANNCITYLLLMLHLPYVWCCCLTFFLTMIIHTHRMSYSNIKLTFPF